MSVQRICRMLDQVYGDRNEMSRSDLLRSGRSAGLPSEAIHELGTLPPHRRLTKDDALAVLLAREQSGMEGDQSMRWQAGK